MSPSMPESLVPMLRRTLQSGKAIAIVGWRDSDHDEFTRSLSTEQIAFARKRRPDGPFGYVLVAPSVKPSERGKATKNVRAHPKLLSPTEIKDALAQCKDLLRIVEQPRLETKPASSTPPHQDAQPDAQHEEVLNGDKLLDYLTHPSGRPMGNMEKFVVAFQKEAAAGDGTVSTR